MAGSLLNNLRMFTSLCGQEAMPNVILVTTMWNDVGEAIGTRREEELRNVFWKYLVRAGCGIERFGDTRESAWRIIGNIMQKNSRANLRLPKEMGDGGKTVHKTEAGTRANQVPTKVLNSLMAKFRGLFSRHARQSSCPVRTSADSIH